MKMSEEQFQSFAADLVSSKAALIAEKSTTKDVFAADKITRLCDDVRNLLDSTNNRDEVKTGWNIMRLAVHAEDASEVSLVAKNMWREMQKFIR